MEKIISKLKNLKKEKMQLIISQKYQEAAELRDTEKKLFNKLKKSEECKSMYMEFIEQKVKEFQKLITINDYRGVMDFFNYAIKNIGTDYADFSNKTYVEFDELKKHTDIEYKIINEKHSEYLTDWILKNLIPFNTWIYTIV